MYQHVSPSAIETLPDLARCIKAPQLRAVPPVHCSGYIVFFDRKNLERLKKMELARRRVVVYNSGTPMVSPSASRPAAIPAFLLEGCEHLDGVQQNLNRKASC